MDSFFEPLADGRWLATVHTTGPWDARFQHGGPTGALLARAVEACAPRPELAVARLTVEILGPIPVGEVTVRAQLLRPGRSVELVEAVATAGGRDCARASAWRIARTSAAVPDRRPVPPALPTAAEPGAAVWASAAADGYLEAVEWRFVRGAFTEPGPAAVWTRLRYPIVAGEEPSPLQRVIMVADSGNGLSGELDLTRFHFINPELTVHLHREAVGEWVYVEAVTAISPGGTGLATTVLSDAAGAVGVGAQSLFVASR